jgi:hypothetical protein
MRLKLLPSEPADVPAIMVCGNAAFQHDGMRWLLFPPSLRKAAEPLDKMRWRLQSTLKRGDKPQGRYLKVVDLDAEQDFTSIEEFLPEARQKMDEFIASGKTLGGKVEGFDEEELKQYRGKGKIVGVAVWIAPTPKEELEKGEGEKPVEVVQKAAGQEKPVEDGKELEPASLQKETIKEVKERLAAESKRVMGDRKDYWCKYRPFGPTLKCSKFLSYQLRR